MLHTSIDLFIMKELFPKAEGGEIAIGEKARPLREWFLRERAIKKLGSYFKYEPSGAVIGFMNGKIIFKRAAVVVIVLMIAVWGRIVFVRNCPFITQIGCKSGKYLLKLLNMTMDLIYPIS